MNLTLNLKSLTSPRSRLAPPGAPRGFTMIELVTVMVLMSLMAAVALPRLLDNNSLKERAAMSQLRGMLVHARQLAVAQKRDVCVVLATTTASAVYVSSGACSALAADAVRMPGTGQAMVINAPSGSSFGGSTPLRFNSLGQPTAGADQNVTLGSQALTLRLETGLPD